MAYKGPFLMQFEGMNQGTQKIEPLYSPGKTKFLSSVKNSTAKNYQPSALQNLNYHAVVLKVEKGWSFNPLAYLPFVDQGTTYTVTARIPGLHDHLPDPHKYKNVEGVMDLYPTFTGDLKSEPAVGAVLVVSFLDNNDKMKKYGNGRIVGVTDSPINGLYEEKNGKPVSPSSGKYNNTNAPSLSDLACSFIDFDAPSPRAPEAPHPANDKSQKEENPQRVGGSYRNRESTSETIGENRHKLSEVAREALAAMEDQPTLVRAELDIKIASMEPLLTGAKDLALMAVKFVSPDSRASQVATAVIAPHELLIEAIAEDIDAHNPRLQNRLKDEAEEIAAGGFEKPPPDCKSIKTVGEYNAAIDAYAENDETLDYPRWPVTAGGYDVNTRQPTAGLWKGQGGTQNLLGGITSLMQAKRTVSAGGTTKTRNHCGIDIATVMGTPILSVLDGEVVLAANTNTDGGATIVVKHDVNGKFIWAGYCHLSGILCSVGQKVKKGTCIGLTGGAKGAWGSGRSGGPHLHFQLSLQRRGNMVLANYVNPLEFFGTKISNLAWIGGGV